MSRSAPTLLTVVAPLFNEAENVRALYRRLKAVMMEMDQPYELILVDNGSSDDTLEQLKMLRAEDPNLHYLSLSRNYGHQGGLIAGLESARGGVVVSMDGDLQHPPEVIPELMARWRQGYDVVFTLKRLHAGQSFLRKRINQVFYATVQRLSGLNITGGQSDFRLMDRHALDAMLALPERGKFLRGLSQWIGFRQIGVEFDVAERLAGRSKFRLGELFRFAVSGIFSFSVLPLRIFTVLGGVVAAVSLLHALYALVRTWYKMVMGLPIVAGFPTLTTGIFFLGGVQLIGIGLLGEYLGRIYDEVKGRPLYILRESSLPPREKHKEMKS